MALVKRSVIYLIIIFSVFVGAPKVLSAYDFGQSTGLNATAQGTGHKALTLFKADNLSQAIGQIIGAILLFIGVVFLGLIIYGGFTWMTARGNEQVVEKAKNLITSAVIGLIIVLAAYALTRLVSAFILK